MDTDNTMSRPKTCFIFYTLCHVDCFYRDGGKQVMALLTKTKSFRGKTTTVSNECHTFWIEEQMKPCALTDRLVRTLCGHRANWTFDCKNALWTWSSAVLYVHVCCVLVRLMKNCLTVGKDIYHSLSFDRKGCVRAFMRAGVALLGIFFHAGHFWVSPVQPQ